jgi:LPS export ABC transporter protein LptC
MSSLFKKHWPLIGIILLLLVAALYIFDTPESDDERSEFTDILLEKGIDLMENISLTGGDTDKGEKWVLNAKEVRVSDDQTVYSGIDFGLKLDLRDGTHIEMKGDKVDYDSSAGEIILSGNVTGQTKNGYRFATDNLLYKEEKGSIETDAQVKIFGPLFSTSGQGLKYNLEDGVFRILADVTTRVDRSRLE